MVLGQEFIILKNFHGEPKDEDVSLVEFAIPPVKDREILVKAEYISVDPYMRFFNSQYPIGARMFGAQVGTIVESKNPNWPVGKKIVCNTGWTTHSVFNPDDVGNDQYKPFIIPDIGDLPASLALGALGWIGCTAYLGFTEICKPKAGETVVVTGAAGAVGSQVGQLAKILGLKVIGIAGSNEKCKWLVEELGFDHAINYKTEDVPTALKNATPEGINCYFDNVGGELSSMIIHQMVDFGRVAVCGSISSYNSYTTFSEELPKATVIQPAILFKKIKMEGFVIFDRANKFFDVFNKNLTLIREGKLQYRETVTEGFQNTYTAFRNMLKGKNIGKAIVKV